MTQISSADHAIPAAGAMPSIEESRRLLLGEIGPAPELTFIRGRGNFGDELIWRGTRELLRGHVYREIDLNDLPSARGEVALLCGGGAWSRRYNELMPEALAIAELRFERVIVLPSSFEIAEDRVREALSRSRATVFAREPESLGQVQPFCRARLAHDLAFFADLSAHERPGSGVLNAFRADIESTGLLPVPEDNDDISDTAASLEDWLNRIADCETVNTDRAHVMIAGARLGKRVNYASSSYFKVDAIAESSLAGYDIAPIETPGRAPVERPPLPAATARTTITVLTRENADGAYAAAASARKAGPDANVVIHDRNSGELTRVQLVEFSADDPAVGVRLANRDGGISFSARLAAEAVEGEYAMLVDDETVISPGAVGLMTDLLDRHPDAVAVTPASAPPGTAPLLGTLFRTAALRDVPFADDLGEQELAEDWAIRSDLLAPGRLISCAEAQITSTRRVTPRQNEPLAERAVVVRELASIAEFRARHDRLPAARVAELVPELVDEHGVLDVPAAELLLAHVRAYGQAATIAAWMNGGLDPLFGSPEDLAAAERIAWLEQRNATLEGIESGGWWQLRGRVEPLLRLVTAVRR